MNARKPLIVLAAGGTGGHVFPAESLATELVRRNCRLALFTDRRGDTYSGVLGELETHRIRAGGVAGKRILALLQSGPELAIGLFQARGLLKKLRPDVVVGFGGYASVPTMLAACMGGFATAIHEQNAVLGRANRLLAPRVDHVATCYEVVEGLPEGAKSKVQLTGMPVRPSVLEQQDTPYPEITVDGPVRLLVIGGSQGARVLSDVVPAAVAALPDGIRSRLHVVQQCRSEDLERVRDAYAKTGIDAELASFFDDVPARMAGAHLVISRAGASTVAEVTAVGRPSLLVPYPYATDNHQARNAHAVDDAGAGWLIPEEAFSAESLAGRIESLLGMPVVLERTAANAKTLGRPDAAKALGKLVIGLIPNGANGDRRAA
ncbi:MAG: undecaprenyldiphospho-muramoylpentapeptide beta-N-acetylglucosaminyltransferase [Rhodospirillaceae bacterium]|nr:undecaprenyldiphospho-muramoylpentapeptide beta-N-acetylglucosaminyltransferase [Rhodospirillaceae bacterium]